MGQEDFQRIQAAAQALGREEQQARLAALKAEKEAALVGISPLPLPSPLVWGLWVEVDVPGHLVWHRHRATECEVGRGPPALL